VSCNALNCLDFNIRTKMGVVRLRQRKWAKRDQKRPEMGSRAGARGSDKWPEKPTFCGFPTADQERKENVPNEQTGGGKLTRRKHSFRWGALKHHARVHRTLRVPTSPPRDSGRAARARPPIMSD
jgi:hypothetical protein